MAKATKAMIASVLATTAIVPAIAVSANDATTTSVTTTAAAQTINFSVEEATGMLARFVTGPATLVEREGVQYMQLNLSDAVLAMVEKVTVGETSALHVYGDQKMVLIPLTKDYAAVNVSFTINSPGGKADYAAVLTPDAASIGAPTAPVEPTTPAVEFEEQDFGTLANGTYAIPFTAVNLKDNTIGYTAISSHFEPTATLIVEDGKYRVQVETTEKSNGMIAALTIAGNDATVVSGTATEGKRVFETTIPSVSALHEASVHVVVPAANMDKHYPFGFGITAINDEATTETPVEVPTEQPEVPAEKPEVEAPTTPEAPAQTAQKMPAFVYADGEAKLSIMQGKYVASEVEVTSTQTGYNVDVTFPEGQHLNNFTVAGATVAKKSEAVVGNNTVKVYTVAVDDLTKMYTGTVDLSVRFGDFSYDEVYKVQMQFGGKQNPFTDIQKSANYGAIVQLYSQGIFKEAAKFNPNNNVKRSQFALMLQRGLNLQVPAATKFTDIANFDKEAQDAIKALNNYGVINGTSATTFAPSADITRKQAALMIYRLLEKEGYKATGATANFSDVKGSDEAAKAIAELNKLGVMTGFEGKFNPQNKLTRNQMAKVLNNALNVIDTLK